jgi:hypothetical protein
MNIIIPAKSVQRVINIRKNISKSFLEEMISHLRIKEQEDSDMSIMASLSIEFCLLDDGIEKIMNSNINRLHIQIALTLFMIEYLKCVQKYQKYSALWLSSEMSNHQNILKSVSTDVAKMVIEFL